LDNVRSMYSILLLEDDADDQYLFRQALNDVVPNAVLVTAKDGDEGLQIINSGVIKPDIVFSDINMPRINGIVFAQTLKEKIPDIPIVLMSTTNNPNHHLEIIKLGVPFYTKPTEFSGITDIIKDGISHIRC
jgi:CheY-like chemotaxis protein